MIDQGIPTVSILGVPVARLAAHDALRQAERLFEAPSPAFIAHANSHTINLARNDPDYRAVLQRADMVLNDGKGVLLAARILGDRLYADLNGNFFAPRLLTVAARRGWRVFFLGSAPGIAEAAAKVLRGRIAGLDVVGTHDGFFSSDDAAVAAVKDADTGLLLVGMGNPLQEKWIDRRLVDSGARLGVGVGAFFDFVTGTVPRAPSWMNHVGIEWAYRLMQEPRRMWKRYLLGNPAFLARVLGQRLGTSPIERR